EEGQVRLNAHSRASRLKPVETAAVSGGLVDTRAPRAKLVPAAAVRRKARSGTNTRGGSAVFRANPRPGFQRRTRLTRARGGWTWATAGLARGGRVQITRPRHSAAGAGERCTIGRWMGTAGRPCNTGL